MEMQGAVLHLDFLLGNIPAPIGSVLLLGISEQKLPLVCTQRFVKIDVQAAIEMAVLFLYGGCGVSDFSAERVDEWIGRHKIKAAFSRLGINSRFDFTGIAFQPIAVDMLNDQVAEVGVNVRLKPQKFSRKG